MSIKNIDLLKIKEMYANNRSAASIALELCVDPATIICRLRKYGIHIRSRHKKYLLISDYFECINTEYKAYWLGFIMADGYNSGKYIRIDIQDEGHLEKLRDNIYINKDMPVRIKLSQTKKNVYYITIHDNKFVSDCEKLGIVRVKSHITKYPSIDNRYDRDFIRGVFDGDGCLTYSLDGRYRRYTFSIVGSFDLISSIRNKILLLDVNVGFRKTKSIYELSIRGNRQIIKMLDWLYDESEIYLERKFNKYDDMITWDG